MKPLLITLASKRKARTAVSCAILALMLTCCARNSSASKAIPPDLSKLDVDPLECITISLNKEIEIKKQVIYEPSIMQDRFMMVLRYREGGDEKKYDPKLLPGYKNVSVVIEAKQGKGVPLVIYRHFSVIEIWKVDAASKTKICYLWTIGKNEASLKLLLEDFSRRFVAERQITINDEQVVQLKAFYTRLLARFFERLKIAPPST